MVDVVDEDVSVFVVTLSEVLAAAVVASSSGRLGCVDITSVPPDLPPEANENCLPRKEPLKPPPPLLLPPPLPGPALLGTLPSPLLWLVSLAVLPRFLLAISYMSPKIPAKVFLRFFMVSSASSTTELWDCGGRCPALDTDEMFDDCDVCESRRTPLPAPPPTVLGTDDDDGSSGSSEMLLRLLSRPMEPTAGEVRSGMGGGPPMGAGLGPAGSGGVGAKSSTGLSARDETCERGGSLPVSAMLGRQTFYTKQKRVSDTFQH